MAEDQQSGGLFQKGRTVKEKPTLTVGDFSKGFRFHQRRLSLKNKDSDQEYRLVSADPERVDYMTEMGFEVCTVEDDPDLKGGDRNPQGNTRTAGAGRYVIMKRPKEVGAMHRHALKTRARRIQEGPRDAFKRQARKLGVETEDKTRRRVGAPSIVIGEGDDFKDTE